MRKNLSPETNQNNLLSIAKKKLSQFAIATIFLLPLTTQWQSTSEDALGASSNSTRTEVSAAPKAKKRVFVPWYMRKHIEREGVELQPEDIAYFGDITAEQDSILKKVWEVLRDQRQPELEKIKEGLERQWLTKIEEQVVAEGSNFDIILGQFEMWGKFFIEIEITASENQKGYRFLFEKELNQDPNKPERVMPHSTHIDKSWNSIATIDSKYRFDIALKKFFKKHKDISPRMKEFIIDQIVRSYTDKLLAELWVNRKQLKNEMMKEMMEEMRQSQVEVGDTYYHQR